VTAAQKKNRFPGKKGKEQALKKNKKWQCYIGKKEDHEKKGGSSTRNTRREKKDQIRNKRGKEKCRGESPSRGAKKKNRVST